MQIVKLNLIPGGVLPVCFASQNDTGRVIRFMLFEGENVFTLSGAESIELRLKKPDGSELVESVTNTGADYVDVVTTADTCDTAGASVGEIAITDGGDVLGSANFGLFVESDAFDGGDIITQTATGAIATFETNIETAFISLKSDINPVQDLHGYSKPWSGGAGKNKFNDTTGTHTINANTDTTITIGDVYLEANTTYTISCKQTPAPLTSFVRNTLSVVGGGTTTYNPAGNDYTIKPMVFTPTVSGTYSIRVWGHTLSANTTYSQFQVEKGSQATSWEPYSNICPISGFSALNVARTGKNLFDSSVLIDQVAWNIFVLLKGEPNSKYTISSNMPNAKSSELPCYVFNSTGNPSSSTIVYSGHSITVTTNADGIIKCQQRRVSGTDSFANYEWQLEKGETATTYEPYNGQTATVNFGQTVYGGVADVTNGKVTITHGIVDLGTLTWSATGNMWFASLSGVKPIYDTTVPDAICSNYKAVSWVSGTTGTEEGVFCFLPAYNQLRIRDTSYSSASDFQTAMSGVQLVYELATPIEISTTPENLTAISGENNVYGDTNGDTTVEYYIEV